MGARPSSKRAPRASARFRPLTGPESGVLLLPLSEVNRGVSPWTPVRVTDHHLSYRARKHPFQQSHPTLFSQVIPDDYQTIPGEPGEGNGRPTRVGLARAGVVLASVRDRNARYPSCGEEDQCPDGRPSAVPTTSECWRPCAERTAARLTASTTPMPTDSTTTPIHCSTTPTPPRTPCTTRSSPPTAAQERCASRRARVPGCTR